MSAVALIAAGATLDVAAQSYNSPESVEYQQRLDRYLVSNTGSGSVIARAADGSLSNFTTDLQSPYGIELLHGTLFVVDSGHVRGFDIDSADPVMDLALAGAQFLNGITSDGAHTLYVSDFSAHTIQHIDVSDLAAPVAGPLISTGDSTPNGVVYDAAGDRVLIATWGANAQILSLLPGADAPVALIDTALSNIDGITLDCHGAIIASAWGGCAASGGCLARFERPFASDSPAQFLVGGLANPADIDYNQRSGDIGVPEVAANTISLHASGCEGSIFLDDFER
jgi:hypothetical protein